MNIRKVTYILYILLFVLFIGYSVCNQFYELKHGNFIEKEIIARQVNSNVPRGGGINYTIIDNENNTYFFSTSEISKILNNIEVRFGETSILIKYNTKNREIVEVSYGTVMEKKKYFSWTYFIFQLSFLSITVLIIYIVSAIKIKINKRSTEMNIQETE